MARARPAKDFPCWLAAQRVVYGKRTHFTVRAAQFQAADDRQSRPPAVPHALDESGQHNCSAAFNLQAYPLRLIKLSLVQ